MIECVDEADGLRLVTFKDGMKFYTHANEHEVEFIYREIFIKKQYLNQESLLANCNNLFDVGANIGMFTVFAKTQNPNMTVHAFEPVPQTFEVLLKNIELHNLKDVYAYNVAISSDDFKKETISFYPAAPGNSTSHPDTKDEIKRSIGERLSKLVFGGAEDICAETRTISSMLEQLAISSLDFLKIDVEGNEIKVLEGISANDFRKIKKFSAEVHGKGKMSVLLQTLKSNKFLCQELDNHDSTMMLFATQQST